MKEIMRDPQEIIPDTRIDTFLDTSIDEASIVSTDSQIGSIEPIEPETPHPLEHTAHHSTDNYISIGGTKLKRDVFIAMANDFDRLAPSHASALLTLAKGLVQQQRVALGKSSSPEDMDDRAIVTLALEMLRAEQGEASYE